MIKWNQKDAWVGVFDILGFKNLIRQTDQEFPRALLTSKLNDLFEALDHDVMHHGQLEYMVFSDTIVIFAPDLEAHSYGWFLLQCTIIINKSIAVRLPLRGAISVGTAFISSSPPMIIGPSFLEAHEYCEDQNWIGLLLTPSATLAVRRAGLEPLHHDFVLDDVPLRKMSSENVLAYRFHNGMSSFSSPLLKFLGEMKHFAPDQDKGKYDRTMAFIEKHYRYIRS
ncbi:MAG: hypothetical protein LLG40_15360 [Deltaproteobacteria bacterium]|nr:hypothetical protein [Deltaproteobacteria bacterium]